MCLINYEHSIRFWEEWIIAKLTVCVKSIRDLIGSRKENLGGSVKICAVVKSNAYGFGMVKVAKSIERDVDYFAVARVSELECLRRARIAKPVVILSRVSKDVDIAKAIRSSGEIAVQSAEDLRKVNRIASAMKTIAKVHIKVDTGMNRFGVKSMVDFKKILGECKKSFNVDFVGLFSHFACASDEKSMERQSSRFEEFVREAKRQGFSPTCHIASSKASSNPKFAFDMVRLGIDLYELDGAINFSGEILDIRKLCRGEAIGYDGAFVAKRDMRVAVVGIGYGDIAVRRLSNCGQVLIGGQKCNIVGNICMDCLFADVTDLDEDLAGKDAVLFGSQGKNSISVCEVAEKCDTISYEILSSMTGRVKREFNLCKSSQENTEREN